MNKYISGYQIGVALALAFAVLTSSCLGMSQEQCLGTNWFEKGKIDAMQGEARSELLQYKKTCSVFNVSTDDEAYMRGRSEGLKIFCTYDSGYEHGRKVGNYRGVCPHAMEHDFLKGYYIGKKEVELALRESALRRRDIYGQPRFRPCTFDSDCRVGTLKGRCFSGNMFFAGSFVNTNSCKYIY